MMTRRCGASGGAPATPTQGHGEIPVARATGGPRRTYTTAHGRGAPRGAPGTPSLRNDEDDLEGEATDMTNPEGLLTGNEFLRLVESKRLTKTTTALWCFVREVDPKDGYRPAHPRG